MMMMMMMMMMMITQKVSFDLWKNKYITQTLKRNEPKQQNLSTRSLSSGSLSEGPLTSRDRTLLNMNFDEIQLSSTIESHSERREELDPPGKTRYNFSSCL